MKKIAKYAALSLAPLLMLSGLAQAAKPQAALPDADPALWVVKDADTTVYLFGTFHALDGKTAWFNDEVKTAFDASSDVVLEILQPDDPAALQPVIMKYAVDTSGKSLTSKLAPASQAKLAKALAAIGAPPTAFDKMRPFFAALTLVMAESQKLGLTAEQGAEAALTKAAKTNRKTLGNLETPEFQIAMFDKLPEAVQIRMLEQSLDTLGEMPALFARMQKAWNAGDTDEFASIMHEMNAQSPESYEIMISDRNATWAEWIDKRLDKPGTVFVAVGAGHLGGKDSVQDLLAARGIKSQRVAAAN